VTVLYSAWGPPSLSTTGCSVSLCRAHSYRNLTYKSNSDLSKKKQMNLNCSARHFGS
jgi:hypothetical protein